MTYPISTSARVVECPGGRFRRILAAVASLVLVALTLAGCTGSPAPSPSTSTSPSPTVSPTPSYKPADDKGKAQNVPLPVMPAEAKAHTKEGLQAFMKHWVGLLSYAYETGDTGPLFEVTGGGCTTCKNVTNVINNAFADGKWIAGGQVALVAADSAMQPNQFGQVSGYVQMNQLKMDFHNANGTVRTSTAASGSKPLFFLVVERENGWELGDIGTPDGGK